MFKMKSAQLFVPDNLPDEEALARTTHMAIGAHQDDLEIMAADGILQCFQRSDRWFSGVIVTNGGGSPRDDLYQGYTDEEMRAVRAKEQIKAAVIGEYAAQALLDYPSSGVKDSANQDPVQDLALLFRLAQPAIVYTHNLADKHDTHVAVTLRTIQAIRSLPQEIRPARLYGCEIWRDLDWILDTEKVCFDVSGRENLQAALLGVYDSQVAGGKRYDLATLGRRRAHATYLASHETDEATGLTFAMDLTPLIHDDSLDVSGYARGFIDRFAAEVDGKIARFS